MSKKDKELLFSVTKDDFDIHYFSGTGAGGQHRNKHQNCVRMSHSPSGASSTGTSHKERQRNLVEAFKKITADTKFKLWHSKVTQELLEKETLDERVDKMMHPDNLRVDEKVDGKWRKVAA